MQDMERQSLNVFRMRLLGAEVREVTSGTSTLKDACSAAIRDWVTNVEDTHYILGSVAGPHPFPTIVSYLSHFFQPFLSCASWTLYSQEQDGDTHTVESKILLALWVDTMTVITAILRHKTVLRVTMQVLWSFTRTLKKALSKLSSWI